jgi:hypothetical protein
LHPYDIGVFYWIGPPHHIAPYYPILFLII